MTDPTGDPTGDSTGDSLGPMPEATTEEPELHPGGVDSAENPLYGSTPEEPTTPDPSPETNPAIEDVVPDEVAAPDDKPQDSSGGSEPTD